MKKNKKKSQKKEKNNKFKIVLILLLLVTTILFFVAKKESNVIETVPPSPQTPTPTAFVETTDPPKPDCGNNGNFSEISQSCVCNNDYTGYNCEIALDPTERPEIVMVTPPTGAETNTINNVSNVAATAGNFTIPEYNGNPYVVINGNVPYFSDQEKVDVNNAFEIYSDLDNLERCGPAFAIISIDTMPTEERTSIGMIKPTGWHTYRFDDLISDKYLYNRCHLIGFQLAGENANELNLITGTRYLNVTGMLPFENEVADYVEDYNGKVLYRVTPIFVDNELVARGVLMEAYSLTDNGQSICFNVFCFNIQPGIQIDYATGEAWEI